MRGDDRCGQDGGVWAWVSGASARWLRPLMRSRRRPMRICRKWWSAGHLEEDLPLDLQKTGTRVDIVTAAQIRNGGFIDVAQSLQALTPGLYISPKSGPFDYVDVSFLGSRTQDVLWLVDGVRINNRLYGGTTPLDTLPASMVERIVILDGPQALFYGTQTASRAPSMSITNPSPTPRTAVFRWVAIPIAAKHIDGYFSDSFGSQHFVVFASDDQSRGFRPFRLEDFQPSATQRDRGFNIRTVGAKYAVDFTDALRLTATAQHTEGRVDDPAPEVVATEFNQRDEDIFSGKLDYTPNQQVQFSPRATSMTGARTSPRSTMIWRLREPST